LLCGVRPEFAKAMANLRFQDWLPAGRVFPEEVEKFSAILKAVRHRLRTIRRQFLRPLFAGRFMGQQPLYYLV
jgi:SulP family sulfate permease